MNARNNIKILNRLLETELAAIDTYENVLQSDVVNLEDEDIFELLKDHHASAEMLRLEIDRLGGECVFSKGVWPEIQVAKSLGLFNDSKALRA